MIIDVEFTACKILAILNSYCEIRFKIPNEHTETFKQLIRREITSKFYNCAVSKNLSASTKGYKHYEEQ